MSDFDLVAAARDALNPRRLSDHAEAGSVGAALLSERGAIHRGVCIDAACGIGFCAEHSAIASLITSGESRIRTIVAVNEDGAILPPCGRCRELIVQIDPRNADTRVLLPDKERTIRELLPDHWLMKG